MQVAEPSKEATKPAPIPAGPISLDFPRLVPAKSSLPPIPEDAPLPAPRPPSPTPSYLQRNTWARDAILVDGPWKLCWAQLTYTIVAAGVLVGGPLQLAWVAWNHERQGMCRLPADNEVAELALNKWQQLYRGPPPHITAPFFNNTT